MLGDWRGKGVNRAEVGRGGLLPIAAGWGESVCSPSAFSLAGGVVLAGLGRVVWFLYAEGEVLHPFCKFILRVVCQCQQLTP